MNVFFNVFIDKQVKFKTPVSIAKNPKINVWLTLIEKEMKQTLAKLLASSVTDVKKLKFVQIVLFAVMVIFLSVIKQKFYFVRLISL